MAFVPASFRAPGSPSKPAALNAGPRDYVVPLIPSSAPAISKAADAQTGRQAPATAGSLRLLPGQKAPGAPQIPGAFAANTGAGAPATRQLSQPPPPKSLPPAALSANAGAPQTGGSLRAPPKSRSLTPKAFAANTSIGKAASGGSAAPTRSLTPSAFAANIATSGGSAAQTRSLTPSAFTANFATSGGSAAQTRSLTPSAFAANTATSGSSAAHTRSLTPPSAFAASTATCVGSTGGSLRAPPLKKAVGPPRTTSLTPAAFAANTSISGGAQPSRESSASLPPKSAPAQARAGMEPLATGGSLRAPPRQRSQGTGQGRSLTPAAFAPPTAGKAPGPEPVPAVPANVSHASYASYVLPVPVAVESVQELANSPATSTAPVVPKASTHLTPAAFGPRGSSIPQTEPLASPTRPPTEQPPHDQRRMPPATASVPPAGLGRPRTVSPPPAGQPRMQPLSLKPAGIKFASSPQGPLATPSQCASSVSPRRQPSPSRAARTSPIMPTRQLQVALTVSSANLPAQAPEPSHRSMMSSWPTTSADISPVITPQSSKYNLAEASSPAASHRSMMSSWPTTSGGAPAEASSKALASAQRGQTRAESPQAQGTFLEAALRSSSRSVSPPKNSGHDAAHVCDLSSDDDDGAASSAPSTLVYLEQAPQAHAKTPLGADDDGHEEYDDDGKKAGAVLAVGVGAQPVVAGLVACAIGAPAATAAGVALFTPILLLAGAALLFPRALENEDPQTPGEHTSQP